MRRSFTRIPRIGMGGGARPGRASQLRSYVGGTDAFGRRNGRPEGTATPDVALQGQASGGTTNNEMNAPEGEGVRSVGYVAPQANPFALVTGLSPSLMGGLQSMYTPDALKDQSMVQNALRELGGGYVWDPAKGQFVPSSGGASAGGMSYGYGNSGLNMGYGG